MNAQHKLNRLPKRLKKLNKIINKMNVATEPATYVRLLRRKDEIEALLQINQ